MKYEFNELRAMAPMYVQGKLQEAERKIFENGLEQYPQLQEDLEVYQSIGSYYKTIEMKAIPPSEKIFNIVERCIEEKAADPTFNHQSVADRIKAWVLSAFALPQIGWGVAAVQCVVILLLLLSGRPGARYETLSVSESDGFERLTIQLVFKDTTEEKEIRGILHSIKGNIVAGPSNNGMYQVSLPESSNIEGIVEELRKKENIRFVEKAL